MVNKTKVINAQIIGNSGKILEKTEFEIENGRFVESLTNEVDAVEVLDLKGKFITPGLIDAHVHVMSDCSADPFHIESESDKFYLAAVAVQNSHRFISKGVTTVRDLGGIDFGEMGIKRAIDSGLIPGPRMLTSGKILTMTGGHGWYFGQEIDGADEARKYARLNIKMGADNIKMMASGGVMTPNCDPRMASLTIDELSAGFEVASTLGKTSASHAQSNEGVKNAIKAGVRTIEHGFWLDQEACDMMNERGIFFTVTFAAAERFLELGEQFMIPEYMLDKIKMAREDHIKSFELALKNGVKIIAGTDAGTPFNDPGDLWFEMQLMKNRGMSSNNALLAATSLGAEALNLGNQIGKVEPGLIADFVVLDSNPLDNFEILESPNAVYIAGKRQNIQQFPRYSEVHSPGQHQLTSAGTRISNTGCACC